MGINATCLQDLRFDRQGRASFSDYHWFVPFRTTRPRAADDDVTSSMRGYAAWGAASEDDVIVTANLPLLGVLATLDAAAGSYRRLAELAIRQWLAAASRSGQFEGLFMRRCAVAGACPAPCCEQCKPCTTSAFEERI